MGKIILLDELTCGQIAAGEVIERPASAVKELIENSVDAGATNVSVEIKSGGIKMIKVTDNGSGFEEDDAVIAFDKHATSKIVTAADLSDVKTMGFRGEALASIAAVSDVTLTSKTQDAEYGFTVNLKAGKAVKAEPSAARTGSVITVRDLFFNTPARYKFLKKDSTEAGYVADIVQKMALAHTDVAFSLTSDRDVVLRTPGDGNLLSAIYAIYGRNIANALMHVSYESEGVSVEGYIGQGEASYSNRNRQIFFVNNRFIKNKTITSAVDEAYKTLTMKGKFPFAVLLISVPASKVDVNVHPTKVEVRFSDESSVFKAVYHGISNTLFPAREERAQEKPQEKHFSFQYDLKDVQPVGFTKEQPLFTAELPQKNTASFDYRKTEVSPANTSQPEKKPESSGFSIDSFVRVKNEKNPDVLPDVDALPKQDNAGGINAENISIYKDGRVVGQILDTYIVMEYGDSLVLLDQHAAHERIMYETIKRRIEERESKPNQLPLLLPLNLSLSAAESDFLSKNIGFFEKLGFEISSFGVNSFVVRSIPMEFEGRDIEGFIVSGIEKAMDNKSEGLYSDLAVYTMACKAAIKANHKIGSEEITALLKSLSELDYSTTCPHGRPIIVKMSKYEIERKFHRA